MILEALSDLCFWVFGLLFDGFSLVTLPMNLVTAVIEIMKYGVWIMGLDLFVIFWSSILFWLTFKLGAGLILFILRVIDSLPFI